MLNTVHNVSDLLCLGAEDARQLPLIPRKMLLRNTFQFVYPLGFAHFTETDKSPDEAVRETR
jgi:hypothetical protein